MKTLTTTIALIAAALLVASPALAKDDQGLHKGHAHKKGKHALVGHTHGDLETRILGVEDGVALNGVKIGNIEVRVKALETINAVVTTQDVSGPSYGGLKAVDSTGAVVGIIGMLGAGANVNTAVTIDDGRLTIVVVNREFLMGTGALVSTSLDCSGPFYILSSNGPNAFLLDRTAVGPNGDLYTEAEDGAYAGNLRINSSWNPGQDTCTEYAAGWRKDAIPVFLSKTTDFVAPFSVE